MQWVAVAGVASAFPMLIAMLFRSFKFSSNQLTLAEDRITELEKKNGKCERRLSIVIFTLQSRGIEVPKEVWD